MPSYGFSGPLPSGKATPSGPPRGPFFFLIEIPRVSLSGKARGAGFEPARYLTNGSSNHRHSWLGYLRDECIYWPPRPTLESPYQRFSDLRQAGEATPSGPPRGPLFRSWSHSWIWKARGAGFEPAKSAFQSLFRRSPFLARPPPHARFYRPVRPIPVCFPTALQAVARKGEATPSGLPRGPIFLFKQETMIGVRWSSQFGGGR